MALPVNGSTHLIPALLLIYRPRKDERLSWPSWLTCSGWFTLISGHPSAAGRAQDRESSPVGDRRSTTVLRHQPFTFYFTLLRTPSCEFLATPLSAAAAAARDGLSRRLHRLQSPQLSPFFFRVQLFHFSCWFYTSRGFVIIGDCNIHPDNAKHHLTSQLLSLLSSFYLTQHVNFQTHNKKHIYDFGITSSDSCNLLLFLHPLFWIRSAARDGKQSFGNRPLDAAMRLYIRR